jgi:hypothetical protein
MLCYLDTNLLSLLPYAFTMVATAGAGAQYTRSYPPASSFAMDSKDVLCGDCDGMHWALLEGCN